MIYTPRPLQLARREAAAAVVEAIEKALKEQLPSAHFSGGMLNIRLPVSVAAAVQRALTPLTE